MSLYVIVIDSITVAKLRLFLGISMIHITENIIKIADL